MSGEFNNPGHESKEVDIDEEILKEINEKAEKERTEAAQSAKHEKELSADKTREKLNELFERNSENRAEIPSLEHRGSEAQVRIGNSMIRKNAADRTIKSTQKQLSKRERGFSKIIHQPTVQAVSDAMDGTLARPSGLLAGGVFSVIGSLLILYICRHYGYEYNFTIGLASFAGGFTFGIIVEGVYQLFRKLSNR